MVKSCPIFDQAAKLGKASRDAYNPGLLLILYDLLENWVSEGVPSDVNDFKLYSIYIRPVFKPLALATFYLFTFWYIWLLLCWSGQKSNILWHIA